jgi:periplasmic divalent cation tolerance protein
VALHTRASLVEAIIGRTNTEHSYEVPCVIALPIQQSNPAYAEWVWEQTSGG